MDVITLYLSPSELAFVRNVPIYAIFDEIRQKTIDYQMTDDGIKIPFTYYLE